MFQMCVLTRITCIKTTIVIIIPYYWLLLLPHEHCDAEHAWGLYIIQLSTALMFWPEKLSLFVLVCQAALEVYRIFHVVIVLLTSSTIVVAALRCLITPKIVSIRIFDGDFDPFSLSNMPSSPKYSNEPARETTDPALIDSVQPIKWTSSSKVSQLLQLSFFSAKAARLIKWHL